MTRDREGNQPLSTGTVKRIPNVRNYGFVVVEGDPGEEVFFHRTAVADDGFDRLRHGQRVAFAIVPDPRNVNKRHAVGVTPIDQ